MDDLSPGLLRERAVDAAFELEVANEMRALEGTDMANDVLTEFLQAEPEPLDWQVGEALAEVLLEAWHGAIWVWNASRDRKTPKASLPGADIVGFVSEDGVVRFLFGEVKSSSDKASPPGVVYGRSGLSKQMERLCAGQDHFALIKWLRARCVSGDHKALYDEATQRYLASRKKDVRLAGCLVRDTVPTDLDVSARATALAVIVELPMRVTFHVWYVPVPMGSWSALVQAAS